MTAAQEGIIVKNIYLCYNYNIVMRHITRLTLWR